jgi:hypothetical protein
MNIMEKSLRQLETFNARGTDGQVYAVRGYEHLARVDPHASSRDQWEPTGEAEYKLADGRHLDMLEDGQMRVPGSELMLERIR